MKVARIFLWPIILNALVFAVLAQPSNVLVSPSSGAGLAQTFAFTASSPAGYTNMQWFQIIFNTSTSGVEACYMYISTTSSTAYLMNDTQTNWVGTATLGSSATLQNSQCAVNLAGSSASGSGNNLTLNLALTFKTGFLGTQNAYLSAGDSVGNSTWQQMGTWTVPGPTAPSGISISPNSGSGNSGTFTATFTDPAGNADIEYMQIWFSPDGTNHANTCMFLLGHSTGLFQVLNDAGTAWQGSIPTGQSDHNSQCTLNTANSGFSYSGNTATMTVNVTFSAAFAGTKGVWLWAENFANEYAWSGQVGSWTVTGAGPPAGVSVSPSSGSGSSQTFTANFADPVSAANIEYLEMTIAANNNGAPSCAVLYVHSTQQFQLGSDSGGWRTGFAPGGSDANNECTLTTSSPGASFSGTAASMTFTATFKPAFVGTQQFYLWTENYAGQSSGTGQLGSWTVTTSGTVATPTISPSSGTYTSPQTVTISTTTSGASIIYTTDGTTPSQSNGSNYTGQFTVSNTTTIQAIAVESGMSSSGVALHRITLAPIITLLSPTSGPVNTPVTIHGFYFGVNQGSSSVSFNGVAANPTSWSSSNIAVLVPPGATTGNVVVTVNGIQATSPQPFTVTPSVTITNLTPTSGSVNTLVTITGSGFGATPGSVSFNGIVATNTTWSGSSILVLVPPGQTTGNVVVTVNGYQTIAPQQFTVNSTIITGPNFPTDFQDCLNNTSGTPTNPLTCELLPGIYTVYGYASLTIGASNLVITGGGGPGETTLRRGSSSLTLESIMTVVAGAATVTNVTISNLTFDGNRFGPGLGMSCGTENNSWDLDLSLPPPGQPGSGTTGAFTVEWVDFINSPATALLLGGAGSTVSVSNVGQGGTGYLPGGGYGTQTVPGQMATRFTGISITDGTGAWYNNISYAGTAGLALGGLSGAPQYAYGNKLTQNRYEMPDTSPIPGFGCPTAPCLNQGGQLFVSGTNVSIAANVIVGNGWPSVASPPYPLPATNCPLANGTAANAGVEAYGFGHSFYNNEINTNTGSGMSFAGSVATGDITISSANPWDPIGPTGDTTRSINRNSNAGISFLGPSTNAAFTNPAVGVTLDDVVVQSNAKFAVVLDSVSNDTSHANPINSAAYLGFINNGCLVGGTTPQVDTSLLGTTATALSFPTPTSNFMSDNILRGVVCSGLYSYLTPAPSHIPGWSW